ncbi:phosphate regulon sensor histidine kinase PhoR [Spartinivicinus poritis]|uniref:Phosphate regulon sensor protein PhoR n=1 Tax=Spartinivicinus poritis TaxID=2994640 RepID=A0ABT5U677_9GAMM|nr:phosphate regulon sensor histidine kinase PhoR [Spartinivicinus sp. A2-2]MDE1461685.1 phosphate regulon sensor histidine kinase PhoR [Spartinivicinus sp. A2-2]
MKVNWQGEIIQRLAITVVVSVLFGVAIGEVAWVLAIVLAGYLSWTLLQVFRLSHWLQESEHNHLEPPESRGIWGDIFDAIYRLQRRDQKARARLQAVIDRVQESTAALNDAVIMVDNQGNLEWWNQAAEAMLGFKSPVDQGQLITNLIRDPAFFKYFDKKEYQEALEVPSPINDQLILQFNITLFGRNDRLLLVRDITRLHNLEQMRKDFVANVSHELRTPLTVIRGYLETLLDNADILPERWIRALQQMQQQSDRMENLVSDLLLLSRLETSDRQADLKPICLQQILSNIISDAKALSGDRCHHIQLVCPESAKLLGHDRELHSAISNLIFNSVKYTPAAGQIDVHWWEDDSGGHLSVMDDGIGIDPKHIPRLTERFYRADPSRSINTGGTGLGLAIVKHVLIRHNARLEIQSELGKGSCFICHFPPTMIASEDCPELVE